MKKIIILIYDQSGTVREDVFTGSHGGGSAPDPWQEGVEVPLAFAVVAILNNFLDNPTKYQGHDHYVWCGLVEVSRVIGFSEDTTEVLVLWEHPILGHCQCDIVDALREALKGPPAL